MTSPSENNKRIAKNTALLYVRMAVTLLVQLYTSRVVLQVLGVTDFGIYNAVGGVVAMLAFINSSMSLAVQRYLSYDLGRGDMASLNRTFNLSLLIHGLIAVVVALLAETAGYYFLTHYMNFPAARYEAACWVFHFSVLTCCVRFFQVPYTALVISFERMGIFAYLSIGEAVLGLAIVYLLQVGTLDKLELYAVLVSGVTLLITAMYAVYSLLKIREIKLRPTWDGPLFRRLLGFASWSALGELAWAATGQGVNVVLNLFFGPVVNASRGIAYQVLGAVSRFTQSFQMAVNPQIIKRYAAGNVRGMEALVFRSTCFSYYLLLLLTLPLFLRMEYVLELWLGQVPPHLTAFCRLTLLGAMTDILSNLQATVAKAYGRIRNYQLVVAGVLMLNLPLSYAALKLGAPAESVFLVYIAVSVSLFFVRLWLIRRMVGLRVRDYLRGVLLPVLRVSVVVLPLPLVAHSLLAETLPGLVGVVAVSCLSVALAVYAAGLTATERQTVRARSSILIRKIMKHGK